MFFNSGSICSYSEFQTVRQSVRELKFLNNYIIYIMMKNASYKSDFRLGVVIFWPKMRLLLLIKNNVVLHTRNNGTKNDVISCGCPRIIYFRVLCCLLHISYKNLFLYFLLLKPLDTLFFMKRYFLSNAIFIYLIGIKEFDLKKDG